jgi:hypothetical protein
VQAPDQIVLAYFGERDARLRKSRAENESFLQRFHTPEYVAHQMREFDALIAFSASNPLRVLNVEQTEGSAIVVVEEPFGVESCRYRYRLCALGGTWLIEERDWECPRCKGAGKEPSLWKRSKTCSVCGGTGWQSPGSIVA